MSDADGLFGYSPAQTEAAAGSSDLSAASLAAPVAVLPLPPAPPHASNRSARTPALASAPAPIPTTPPVLSAQAARTPEAAPVPAGAIVDDADGGAEAIEIAALPETAPAAAAPAAGPISAATEDGERDRMIASALAPASTRQTLGELQVGSNGTLILPAARDLEVIDIAPIRDSMRETGAPEL